MRGAKPLNPRPSPVERWTGDIWPTDGYGWTA